MDKAANSFFEESSEQSRVKAAIVSKYFDAWAKVIMGAQNVYHGISEKRIAYIDLFAGPGRYVDGTKSTPLLILEKAIQNDIMRERLVTVFNDRDEANINSLQEAINQLPGVERLKHKPQVRRQEVGEEIVKMFEQLRQWPCKPAVPRTRPACSSSSKPGRSTPRDSRPSCPGTD